MAPRTRRRVALVAAGGTITSVGSDRLDLAFYAERGVRLGPHELLARIPEASDVGDVEPVVFRALSSDTVTDGDWLELRQLLGDLCAREDVDGCVVTQGTNALEETAYFLTLTLKTAKPVVVVGAMRPPSGLSADGDLNLLDALRVAASPEAREHGVLVLMTSTIYSARDATKANTHRIDAPWAREMGPLGYVDASGRVRLYHGTRRRHTLSTEFDVSGARGLPRVDVVISYVGATGAAIDALVEAGARGIVVAGSGPGRPTRPEKEALLRARGRAVISCLASRVASGTVLRGDAMRRDGFVAADNLPPWKARILLSLALTRTSDPDRIQEMFDVY